MPTTELSTNVVAGGLPTRPEAANARPVRAVAAAVPAPEVSPNETKSESPEPDRASGGAQAVDMAKTVNRLNDLIQTVRRELRFSVDDLSGDTVITVIDSETQEVVRQIPPRGSADPGRPPAGGAQQSDDGSPGLRST